MKCWECSEYSIDNNNIITQFIDYLLIIDKVLVLCSSVLNIENYQKLK